MFSTQETSVHVREKNREISPLDRGRLRGKGSGGKASFKTRMEDRVRHADYRFRSRVRAWRWRRALWGGRLTRNAKRWRKFVPSVTCRIPKTAVNDSETRLSLWVKESEQWRRPSGSWRLDGNDIAKAMWTERL